MTTGLDQHRRIDQPRPGFFKMKIVKGGCWVGAEIRYSSGTDPDAGEPLDRGYLFEALIGNKHVRPPSPDPMKAGVFRIWLSAIEIPEREYRFLIADADWCAKHAPEEPQANPKDKIDIVELPPSHFLPR